MTIFAINFNGDTNLLYFTGHDTQVNKCGIQPDKKCYPYGYSVQTHAHCSRHACVNGLKIYLMHSSRTNYKQRCVEGSFQLKLSITSKILPVCYYTDLLANTNEHDMDFSLQWWIHGMSSSLWNTLIKLLPRITLEIFTVRKLHLLHYLISLLEVL